MNTLKHIIYEAVRDALNEARSIKSPKLQRFVSQYGGIFRSDGRFGEFRHKGHERYSADLHNIGDEDVVGVVDSHRANQLLRSPGLWEGYANENGITLGPTDHLEAVRLADGEHYVMVVVRRYYSDSPLLQKRDHRAELRHNDGANGYIRPRVIRELEQEREKW